VTETAIEPTGLEHGTLVLHPARPAWGPGRVLAVKGHKLTVYFRDFLDGDPNGAVKMIDTVAAPLQRSPIQTDSLLDNLPPYENGAFVQKAKGRVTLGQGIERFGSRFPLYFEDPTYLGDAKKGERNSKWAAHQKFVDTLGGGLLEELLAADNIAEIRRRALAVEASTNLLSVFEKAALREAIAAPDAAREFFTRLSAVLLEPTPSETTFQAFLDSVDALPSKPGKSSGAKWTIATILPYLADPTRFMFFKPEVTQKCAARLMFDLQYSTDLEWATYERLLAMSDLLLARLGPNKARDFIDVQSFVWLIGQWKET
jgi:hypothetical protein